MMKKVWMFAASLLMTASLWAQSTPAPQAPVQPAAATQASTNHGPQAKTPEELKAYQDALALAKNAPALEAAANAFAEKYPDSELRASLFQQLTAMYDNSGASDKAVALARRTLSYDSENALALVILAGNLAEHTKDSDLDKAERLSEAVEVGNKALGAIDHMFVPPNFTPAQAEQVKNNLRSWAYDAIGLASYSKQQYPASEAALLKSVELGKDRPNLVTLLRLAITQDKLTKYTEAMSTINKCLAMAQPGSAVEVLAKQEKDRLTKLTANLLK